MASMDLASASLTARAPSRAAQYVRMSTEHQQYSPENQIEIIRQYAAAHNMEIVQEYSDLGRSGLNIAGREGLNQLMADVEAKRTNFTSLLVYDVSRWGRFQDVDESAYYEYVLKRSGIRVHYCAEQFENDGSMSSSVLKTLKRSMAAEYSRELSVKVFSGQCRLIELGFRQGGPAGYGLQAPANRSQSGAQRAAWPGRAEEPADRPGHPGPGPRKGDRGGPEDLHTVCHGQAD